MFVSILELALPDKIRMSSFLSIVSNLFVKSLISSIEIIGPGSLISVRLKLLSNIFKFTLVFSFTFVKECLISNKSNCSLIKFPV